MKKSNEYHNEEGLLVVDITNGKDTFKAVECLGKYQTCDRWTCKYYSECHAPVMGLDCIKNSNTAQWIVYIIIGIILAVITTWMVSYNIGFGLTLFWMIVSIAGTELLVSFFGFLIGVLREASLLEDLKMEAKRKERINKQLEKQRNKQDIEKMAKDPNYKNVLDAESCTQKLEKMINKYDFGSSNKKIKECVKKLNEIVKVLKEDTSGYARVAFLLEAAVPEFYNTLNIYSRFIKAEETTEEYEQILKECVDKFYKYLNMQKKEAILDKETEEVQFKSMAEALKKMMDEGE